MHKPLCTLILLIALLAINACNDSAITDSDKTKIIEELNDIEAIDQKYAGLPPDEMMEKYGRAEAWKMFEAQRDSVGQLNQSRIKDLYRKYGFLGVDKVGEEAATSFWLPIQHADEDIAFQKEMLSAMGAEKNLQEIDKYHYAMLEDRINVNENKPQRFGSQLDYNDKGQAIPKIGLQDSMAVDSLRAAYHLPTFKEYYNSMTEMHFEMNKAFLLEKGISEPVLYK